MKKFLAIYLGSMSGAAWKKWQEMDETQRKKVQDAGMKAWFEWGAANKAAIVEQGAPLGKTKRADREGVSDTKNDMSGYVIVQAESHEAAARMFVNHPHFTVFPGESVEIMECLPMPELPQR
jgi:hypothetical protein